MIKLGLAYLNTPLILLLGLLGIGIQTSLFTTYPFNFLQPDVLLILVLWLALRRTFYEGGILTLLLAGAAESHSSAPHGVMLVAYMLVFLMTFGIRRVFVLPDLTTLVFVALGATLVWKTSTLVTLAFLGLGAQQWRHTAMYFFPGAVIEGVLALWLARGLERFDWVTYKNPKARQLLEDELLLEGEGL